jgi:hypothetical protein
MATDLVISDPIDVPFRKQQKGSAKHITSKHGDEFWGKVVAKKFAKKQGCYVFALRAAKGYVPWYIGKATKSFEQETFTDHKRGHYNDALFDGPKGTPVLFFVTPHGNKQKVPANVCNQVETFLIQSGYIKNPDLKNRQQKKRPDWTIGGVVRPTAGRHLRLQRLSEI